MANLGAVTALVGKGDTVLEDRLNHASLLDAGLLSGARFSRYLHNDPASLAARLDKAEGNTLVVTDGVFSMDGNLADLPALAAVAQARGAWLMVDDAHGFGPLGASGGGIVEHFGLGREQVPVLIGTLGKGFGTAGAFVAGSEELIETLIQYARPYIYTTSQPPAVACATLKSLELLRRGTAGARQRLAALMDAHARRWSAEASRGRAGLRWHQSAHPPTVPAQRALRVSRSAGRPLARSPRRKLATAVV